MNTHTHTYIHTYTRLSVLSADVSPDACMEVTWHRSIPGLCGVAQQHATDRS